MIIYSIKVKKVNVHLKDHGVYTPEMYLTDKSVSSTSEIILLMRP